MPEPTPHEPAQSWVMVAAVSRAGEADEVAYALKLRGIEARTVRLSRGLFRGKTLGVEVRNDDEAKAREALPFIWDGMVEQTPGVVRTCPFCDYDLAGLPADAVCPECGQAPNSAEARRRAAERGP